MEKFLREAENKDDIFKLARKLKAENVVIAGNKCVRNDTGQVSYTDEAKLAAWKEHYEQLLNVEFPWDPDSVSPAPPVEGPTMYIAADMAKVARGKMKLGKAPGLSCLCAEMLDPLKK